jgi:hypothetical protein
MSTYMSTCFNYNPDDRTFSCEASALRDQAIGPIFPDTPLQPFSRNTICIKSRKTGTVVGYVMKKIERDPEGDILMWHLEPSAHSVRLTPCVLGTSVIIFND